MLKRFIGYAAMLALVSIPAFAATNSEKVTFSRPVTVGTTNIPAADYKITWNKTGSNVQVTLTNGKAVVTLPASVVEAKHGAVSVRTNAKDGVSVLQGIDLHNVSVEFTSSPNSGQ
jgi:hypothetical protein